MGMSVASAMNSAISSIWVQEASLLSLTPNWAEIDSPLPHMAANPAVLGYFQYELSPRQVHSQVAAVNIQLVPCDSVNCNKVSIRLSPFFYFPSLTTCEIYR
jgi:hypothetical protein